jgi:hypothetical protein
MRFVKLLPLVLVLSAAAAGRARAADCSAAPGDADGDGICDAVDPCVGFGTGWRLREATLKLRKLGGRLEDDTLRFRAILPLLADTVVDPAATGLRLTVLDNAWTSDDLVLDVAAPGGSGWRVDAGGRSWIYRASDFATSGIKRAMVKEIEANPAYILPRAFLVAIDARRGTYDPTSDLESHYVTLAFAGTGVAEICANQAYYPWLFTGLPGVEPWEALPWQPSCKFRSDGRTLECASGPQVGPCRVSGPGDMMVCDAENAAAAQDRYWIATGTYYSGACTGLPGFTASPNVTCTTTGDATAFSVSTSHVDDVPWFECVWNSRGTPNLACL